MGRGKDNFICAIIRLKVDVPLAAIVVLKVDFVANSRFRLNWEGVVNRGMYYVCLMYVKVLLTAFSHHLIVIDEEYRPRRQRAKHRLRVTTKVHRSALVSRCSTSPYLHSHQHRRRSSCDTHSTLRSQPCPGVYVERTYHGLLG